MLIILQQKNCFQYIKKNSWLHVNVFYKEQWVVYFTLLAPTPYPPTTSSFYLVLINSSYYLLFFSFSSSHQN
jgi:hypothetical protein